MEARRLAAVRLTRVAFASMPVRATKRGAERTPLDGDADVLICGASLRRAGGRARAARQRRQGAGDRPLRDRRAPDERVRGARPSGSRTSASRASIRQTFRELVIHRPRADVPLDAAVDVLDVRLPRAVRAAAPSRATVEFETATVDGRTGSTRPHRPRRSARAADRRRAGLAARPVQRAEPIQPPEARLSRGLEVHPHGARRRPRALARPRSYMPAGYSWSFPAGEEVRVGVGSFDPRDHVKEPTVELAGDLGVDAVRYQGNWIPHQLRPAARTASSSPATAPATACRRPPRASAPRSTSASPAAASCARSSTAARRASRRCALRLVLRRPRAGRSAGCCASRRSSAASRSTPR